jgi:hypothetical protein
VAGLEERGRVHRQEREKEREREREGSENIVVGVRVVTRMSTNTHKRCDKIAIDDVRDDDKT